jgi:hypothetical protein
VLEVLVHYGGVRVAADQEMARLQVGRRIHRVKAPCDGVVVSIGVSPGREPLPVMFRVRNRGRCAGPPWRREKWSGSVRDADESVMPFELVSQDGVGDHRQELSIVAVSTRTRLFGPVVPPDGAEDGWSSREGFGGRPA